MAIISLEKEYLNLSENGSFFCIVKSQYRDGCIEKDFFDLVEYATEKLNLYYINTIVIPEDTYKTDNILYCVWFVKDKKEFYFNKDKIREKPIWKDVEWGKRKKNYNPKGKDPGNVWIPTNDDGKGNITEHILLSIFNVFNRILDATIPDSGKYLILVDSDNLQNYKYNKFGEIRYIPYKNDDICLGSKIRI